MSKMTKLAPMRRVALLAAAAFAWTLHAGVVMDRSTVDFRPVKGGAEIAYTLGDDPAIVTLEIQTNTLANGAGEWLDIGGWNVQSVFGDANRIVRETGTQRKIYWKASKDMPERIFKDGTIRAVLTAWATNAPPDYMVVGLREANDVERCPVSSVQRGSLRAFTRSRKSRTTFSVDPAQLPSGIISCLCV